MIATITAFDELGAVSHRDTRHYSDLSLLWEHVGCQQNNHKTVRVRVDTDSGVEYEVLFSAWTPARHYRPSFRFRALLEVWARKEMERDEFSTL